MASVKDVALTNEQLIARAEEHDRSRIDEIFSEMEGLQPAEVAGIGELKGDPIHAQALQDACMQVTHPVLA